MGRKRLFNEREKWCNRCSSWLPLKAFGENQRTASGRQDYCKTCHNNCPSKQAEYLRKTKYGVTQQSYQNLFDKQEGKCVICQKVKRLCIDHNHRTGAIRGLLCIACNSALGLLKEDPMAFERAIQYLKADYALQL